MQKTIQETNSTYAKDYSGYNNDATTSTGSPLFNSTGGKIGGAMKFDGTSLLQSQTSDSLNLRQNFTISLWAKFDSKANGDTGTFVRKEGVFTFGFEPGANPPIGGFISSGGWCGTYSIGSTNIDYGKWYHLVFIYNSTHLIIYLNGTIDGTYPCTGILDSNSNNLGIGGFIGNTQFFNGTMDELIIFNMTLSNEQILQLYNDGLKNTSSKIIVSEETNLDEEWLCSVTPNDGQNDGLTKNSSSVIIFDTGVPTWVDDPVIEPSTPTVLSNLSCEFTVTDADGDNVVNITNWYKNNKSITVLYMPFEGNGNEADNAADYSGYGNNGTVFGATWNRTGGKIGGAYEFVSASSNYLSLSNPIGIPIGNDNYTIEAWINPDNGADNMGIVGWGNYGTNYEVNAFRTYNGCGGNLGLVNYWWGEDISACSSYSVGSQWFHVAVTYDGTTRTLWINGDKLSSDQPSNTHNVPNTNNFRIGFTNSGEYFDGHIDELRIYNRSLTRDQLYQNYLAGNYSKSPNILIFNETNEGEEWLCSVTPNDGQNDGLTKNSSSVIISSSTPPTWVDDPVIEPSTPTVLSNLSCEFNVTDADGDNVVNITRTRLQMPA